jgi:hypothetical protein
MLTSLNLSKTFKHFCAGRNCDECHISELRDACLSCYPGICINCDVVWFVYDFLADRGLLHKNPNSLVELLSKDDLRKLVARIAQTWYASSISDNFSENPFDPVHPYQCALCTQRLECDNHPISCRLYFALENYKYLIHHDPNLRETCYR